MQSLLGIAAFVALAAALLWLAPFKAALIGTKTVLNELLAYLNMAGRPA